VALEGHHARAHQPVLQAATTRPCCCSRFWPAVHALEQALDARDVADRLGERPRQLLYRRIAIELQRIEVLAPLRLALVPEEDLGLVSRSGACSRRRVTVRPSSARLNSVEVICCSTRARKMLTSPELFSSSSSNSALTRASHVAGVTGCVPAVRTAAAAPPRTSPAARMALVPAGTGRDLAAGSSALT
jgi:hypothetical protein